jgi:hypothetical protein
VFLKLANTGMAAASNCDIGQSENQLDGSQMNVE